MNERVIAMKPGRSPVEVSGWGPGADFFLENTTQQETGPLRRRVCLYYPVQTGALLLVRRTGLLAAGRQVVYHVEHVGRADTRGRREVLLGKLSPGVAEE